MTPRYFIPSIISTSVSSTFRAFILHFSNCDLDPKSTNSVLSLFILSLFSFIQTFRVVAHSSSLPIHLSSSFHSPGLNLLHTTWSSAKTMQGKGWIDYLLHCAAVHVEQLCTGTGSLGYTKGQFSCNTLSHPMNFAVHSLGCGSGTGGVFGTSAGEGVVIPFSSYTSGMATPWKTSSSVKVRYHFTSSLSSNMPFAN